MKIFFRALLVGVVLGMLSWVGTCEYYRAACMKQVWDTQARAERELVMVESLRGAQQYATPVLEMAAQLAEENAMFTEVIDRARDLVREKEEELARTKQALSDSIELLQDQIEENNDCVDEIRSLEARIRELYRTINELMEKIPNPEDVEYPYDPAYNN